MDTDIYKLIDSIIEYEYDESRSNLDKVIHNVNNIQFKYISLYFDFLQKNNFAGEKITK
jgi:hypothetical protein